MDIQDAIALTLVLAAAVYAVRYIYKALTGDGGCGHCGSNSSTDHQASASHKSPSRPSAAPKITPLVTLDQVGRPYDTPSKDSDQEKN